MIFSNSLEYLQVFRFLFYMKVTLRLPANVIAKGRGALANGIVGAGHGALPQKSPFSTKVNCLRCAAPEALEKKLLGQNCGVRLCEIILSYCNQYFYSPLVYDA